MFFKRDKYLYLNNEDFTINICGIKKNKKELIIPNIYKKKIVVSIGKNSFFNHLNLEKVIISEGVENIFECAFSKCTSLKHITIPNSITNIGEGAFFECENLESIVIPEGITRIESNTFKGCTKLKDIVLPSTLKIIGEKAFSGCSNLENIVIPEGVIEIKRNAFEFCCKLKEIKFPNTLLKTGKDALYKCDDLRKISLPFLGESLNSHLGDNFLGYIFGAENCLENKEYVPQNLKSITIESCNDVLDSAFFECENLESIVIPEGITRIESNTFKGCTKLKDIVLPSTLKIIGEKAFSGCSNLENIVIPEGVIEIKRNAFEFCLSLLSLSFPVSLIINDTDVENYLSLILGVKENFGESKDFNLGFYENRVYMIKNKQYKDKNRKEIIIPYGVTEIKEYDFFNFTNLESVFLPKTIKNIKKSAFEDCYNLREVIIEGDIEKIEGFAFSNCRNLRKIDLPNSLLEIGEFCFFGCTSLEEIKLPNKIKIIEKSLFENCVNLKTIHFPFEIEKICEKGLYNCGCEEIFLPERLTILDNFSISHCDQLKKIILHDNIKRLGDNVFDECPLLTLNINKGINYIGNVENPHIILVNCIDKNIESFETLKGTKIIKNKAFINCDKLVKLIIHNDVIQIGKGAFENCCSLKSITLPFVGDGNEEGTFGYIFGNVYDENFENINVDWNSAVPQTIKEVVLTNIFVLPNYSFAYCKNIERIVLPNNLKEIKSFAFMHCNSLSMMNSENVGEIIIPKDVINIGSSAFYGCDFIDTIKFNENIEFIGNNAFENCSHLKTVIISDGVIEIEKKAFYKCKVLKNIFLGKNIKRIGDNAFYGCSNKKIKQKSLFYEGDVDSWLNIKFENKFSNPMVIADEVYFKINNEYILHEDIIISKSNVTIGNYQFFGYKTLKKLKIINGIDYLGESAFEKCVSLNEIQILGNIHYVNEFVFKDCNSVTTITIPKVVDKYGRNCHFGYLFGAVNSYGNEEFVPNGLEYVKLVGKMYSVPEFMFYKCKNIGKLILPNNIRIIKESAFESCGSIVEIKLPSTLEIIEVNAFKNCQKLVNIKFNDRLKKIEGNAFLGCTSLSNIDLPKNLELIHRYAFGKDIDVWELVSENTGIYNNTYIRETYYDTVDDFSLRDALEGIEDAYYNLYGEWPDDNDW